MRTNIPRVVPVAGLLIGFSALLRGLLMLDRDPWLAVLGLLAAMAVLLASAACLFRDDSFAPAGVLKIATDFEPYEGEEVE